MFEHHHLDDRAPTAGTTDRDARAQLDRGLELGALVWNDDRAARRGASMAAWMSNMVSHPQARSPSRRTYHRQSTRLSRSRSIPERPRACMNRREQFAGVHRLNAAIR